MKVRELKDLLLGLQDRKYDDYSVVFWDYARQKAMDGSFGGLSHPDKEISIPIHVVGEKYTPLVKIDGLPEIVPSPFREGKNAYLHVDDSASLSGINYTRYFYECEETGHQFGTTESETYSLCSFYCEECRMLKGFLQAKGIKLSEVWEEFPKLKFGR